MNRLLNAMFYGFLMTLYGSSFYAAVLFLMAMVNQTDPAQVWNSLWLGILGAYIFLTMLTYDWIGIIEKRNREGRERLRRMEEEEEQRRKSRESHK